MSDRVLKILGLDEDQADIVREIVRLTESRFKILAGLEGVPRELEYIVIEVSVIRYNRIGSEGSTSHNVGGETRSFYDSDFDPYLDDIEAYKDANGTSKRKVFFY